MRVLHERRCPQCGSLNIHRSRQTVKWGRLLKLMGTVPYRCHDCNTTHLGKKSLKRLYRVTPDEDQE